MKSVPYNIFKNLMCLFKNIIFPNWNFSSWSFSTKIFICNPCFRTRIFSTIFNNGTIPKELQNMRHRLYTAFNNYNINTLDGTRIFDRFFQLSPLSLA
ncbi:hypothetical protein Leryth_024526 [Lithospermum erythrorhizon]|nr:hypothetical protein Leryth_024526 [Lithospermum erythrorhizon]